ncbi:imm11 family protein [Chryseobacterium indoltheticum]|uniref:imm11 family protein n=1 Tax=Chryseobacterium indoltheticum TaxID=254 RepID=UPI004041F108
MKQYFKLSWTTNEKKNAFIKDFIINENLRNDIINGISIINKESPLATLSGLNANKPDILVGGAVFPIVSEKFRNEFTEKFTQDIQFIEFLPITFKNENFTSKYYLMNILKNINCFDFEKSEYTKLPIDIFPDQQDLIFSIEKLQFKYEKINNRNIFRMSEKSTDIYLSEEFKKFITNNEYKGFAFEEI